MLCRATPDELKLLLIDPKLLELSVYEGIPHLIADVVTNPKRAAAALAGIVRKMEERYQMMAALGVRSIDNSFFFPRAERMPPNDPGDANNFDFVRREDLALTTHVLGSACSEFIVEWTYYDGVGFLADFDETDNLPDDWRQGVIVPPVHAQPWFGWRDIALVSNPTNLSQGADPERGVFRYMDWAGGNRGAFAIDPNAIERPTIGFGAFGVVQYRAYFGMNRTEPRDVFDLDGDNDFQEVGVTDVGYTPWPNAVRITMTIHDPDVRLANGRTFQFIVELPEREQ